MTIKTLTFPEWQKKAIDLYGEDIKKWKFRCPACKEIQTLQDFIDHNIPDPDTLFYFSCIGRWVEGRGCNWTLGGLFPIHQTEVIDELGQEHPVMEFAD